MTSRSAPPSSSRACWAAALLALAVLVLALPATATTYVMPPDEYLVESSTAAVQARVLSVDSAPGMGMPATDYMIEVEEVLAGEVTGRNLIVRVPGGVRADGIGLHLYGMPEMIVGERVLLFLNPSRNEQSAGTWAVSHLMLGVFHEVLHQGERYLVRNLTGAVELAMPGEEPGARARFHRARRAKEFTEWVEQRGRGRDVEADYFAEPDDGLDGSAGPSAISGQFRLFDDPDNRLNIRWFEFDEGGNVPWRMQNGGQPGYSPQDTAAAMRTGMGAWNSDNGSIVNYTYAGTTGSSLGLSDTDGINAVVFADPDNSISSDFSCTGGGGTLAVGGPFYFSRFPRLGPGGKQYNVAAEGFVVTNKGIECLLTAPGRNAQRSLEQLLGHEFGHSLGIDHPCEPDEGLPCNALQSDAMMYPFLHNDDRGAVLNSDDRNAVRSLYPGSGSGGGPVPSAPSGLVGLVVSSTSIQLAWNDNSGDETAFILQRRIGGGSFIDLVTLPADTEEYLVEGLQPQTLYGFRVRARNGNGNSAYSNSIELETLSALPSAPTGLAASPLSQTSVGLSWTDTSDNETDFVVEGRNPDTGAWVVVRQGVVAPANTDTVTAVVDGLASGVPHSFRVLARNLEGLSNPSNVAAATPPDTALGTCVEEDGAICLLGNRFRVSVAWRNQRQADDSGIGVGEKFANSERTGRFWFFNQDNTELIVKVLDGTAINDYYWTFYGALTDVEYWVTVLDTTDGSSRTYYNPPFEKCGQADTTSIPSPDVPLDPAVNASSVRSIALPAPATAVGAVGTCTPDATTLCLLDGRFAVTVDWEVSGPNASTGDGMAVADPDSERTGYFWFFSASNIELVVKALDATAIDGNFWFFYGALSNVEYTITVTDTVLGQTNTYTNPQGNYCGQFDTSAFTPDV